MRNKQVCIAPLSMVPFLTPNPTVAVFGALGHTGRFVLSELLRRGITPIAIARDAAALAVVDFSDRKVLRRPASVDQQESLNQAIEGAQAIINCAGPFIETANAVATAAVQAGIHYLDVTAEQPSARTTLDQYDLAARAAGIVVLPAMGFYGGFADLLVTAALGDWDFADSIEIMVGLDSWHPTRGTRITGERNTAQRMVITGGELVPAPQPAREMSWNFGDPLGCQLMVEVPLAETILISRHVNTANLHTYLSNVALNDIRNLTTPGPKPADATGRSAQRFAVEVVGTRGAESHRIIGRGRDIYAFTAPLVCEVTERLLKGLFLEAGAHAPGAIFDAKDVLAALAPDHLTFEITSLGDERCD
jgi:uncharacterized protein YbjT (DUF2867 family)